MVCFHFITFSMALFFVIGPALAVGSPEEIENDVGCWHCAITKLGLKSAATPVGLGAQDHDAEISFVQDWILRMLLFYFLVES